MSDKKLSVTYTVLIWTGIVLIVTGLIMTLFGIGSDTTAFEVTVLDIAELSTSHIGLVLIVVGAFLAGIVSLRLPSDVRIFSEDEPNLTESIAENALLPSAALGSLALLILVVSILL